MIFGSLKRIERKLKPRMSASDYGQRRIGNRVQIPNGSAAVMDDESPKKSHCPSTGSVESMEPGAGW
jgi:hypothetical protein